MNEKNITELIEIKEKRLEELSDYSLHPCALGAIVEIQQEINELKKDLNKVLNKGNHCQLYL